MGTVTHYDIRPVNEDYMVLDLPLREATGSRTSDVAKPHHPVTLIGAPTWTQLASLLGVLEMDGTTQYGQCLGASCVDLNFMSGDYSIGGWFNWTVNEFSQIIIARYELSVSGWEVYTTQAGALNYLTLRHHHAGGATTRTGAYSIGWTPGTPWFFGISRSGASAQFYRNGLPVETTSDVLIDPETCAEDLLLGVRYTKNANFLLGYLYRPRVWSRAMSAAEWLRVHDREAGWFP
ncbi:hypothetical protein LCGC14_1751120 [marine sediment metagenome]|uniref:LamG-like jellyroll fold domain-containing protein n=1 Tax=marine sediment metagenome TaxID=412755 RepID=A0A0F9JIX9_9ZZZZ